MMQKYSNLRMLQDYYERVQSLVVDGYCKRHEVAGPTFCCCRLHHMSNGNDIVITLSHGVLTQKTNHVVTFMQDYEKDTPMHQP